MTTLTDIVLPADQTEGTTNVVGTWFKVVGDPVEANEPLLEITTDKVTVEIAAPASGVLVEVLKAEGDSVEPGDVVGRVGPAGALPPPTASAPAASTAPAAGTANVRSTAPVVGRTGEIRRPPTDRPGGGLSPAARRMLRDHDLDAADIAGSGRGGRITMEDIERHLAESGAATSAIPSASTTGNRRVPHSQMRKTIAAHMSNSMATAPHVTTVFEADLSSVLEHRVANKAAFAERGVALTLTAYFVRATVEALGAVPEVNSRWHDDALELFGDRNIGIGTALEHGGLIVPVLARAQDLDLAATAEQLQDLTSRARAGTLSPKDVQGGTFTISNHGVSGSLVATPIIINQPQSAILGIGKLHQRPVAVQAKGGGPAVHLRPMIYVTLTIDHRVLDGFQANAFLVKWVEVIESDWG